MVDPDTEDQPGAPYPLTYHDYLLERLCRYCGCIVTGYSYNVGGSNDKGEPLFTVEEVDEAFNTKSSDDSNNYPTIYCNKCYTSLLNFRRRGSRPSSSVKWLPHTEDSCEVCLRGKQKQKGGRPSKKKAPGKRKNVATIEDIMNLDASNPLPKNVEAAISHAMSIKMKQSTLPNKSVLIATGGNKSVTLTPIVAPRKESTEVTERTVRKRSQQGKNIIKMIAGSSKESFDVQTAAIVKSCDQKVREAIISKMNTTVTVPPAHVAAMKSCLNLPWNLLRDIRRWLATFKVNIAPEGKTRVLADEWIGTGLRNESAPLTVLKNKKTVILQKPWSYLFNLVGHVLKRLDDLQKCDLFVSQGFIPDNEIHLKIGGDHGGGSFKMCYQLTCVEKPNSADNTIIFSTFEAKDNIANLRICLERFKAHVEKFKTVKWQDKTIRVFMFGDYAFLCAMFGLSGANGVHPCLWCLITKEGMQQPYTSRAGKLPEKRTLENLKEHLELFLTQYGGNVKYAKKAFNVINTIFFGIPIEQVFIPGLHITLGVYLKMFNLFIEFCEEIDLAIMLEAQTAAGSNDNSEFLQICRDIRKLNGEVRELEERYFLLQEEIAWLSISDESSSEQLAEYEALVSGIDLEIQQKKSAVDEMKAQFSTGDGPCVSSIDAILKKMSVERQKYHSNCFVGNDCHKLLVDKNIKTLCSSIPEIVRELNLDNVYTQAVVGSDKFQDLFTYYAKCHVVFNSARHLSQNEMDCLRKDIDTFMSFFRTNWPQASITPKLHMLEDHTVDFVTRWKSGCGFYGEQGGEAIHNVMNKKQTRYKSIKNDVDRLGYLMKDHLMSCHPEPRSLQPQKKKRAFKKARSQDK